MANTRRLLVEGKQDWHVFDHVCYAHGIDIGAKLAVEERAFELKNHEGFDTLRSQLRVTLKGSALTHVGVVVDFDTIEQGTGLSPRWCSIRDLFRENGYDCPTRPVPEGIILHQEDKPTVGLWVMPDNLTIGKLETFMSHLVPTGSQLWTWAKDSVNTAPACEERFDEKDREKAEVHSYLAVQKQPGSAMGSGVRKQYFDANADLAVRFITWVRDVFDLPVAKVAG